MCESLVFVTREEHDRTALRDKTKIERIEGATLTEGEEGRIEIVIGLQNHIYQRDHWKCVAVHTAQE